MTGRCSTGPQRVRRPGHIQRSRPGCGYPRRGWLQVHLSADRQGVQHLEGDGAVRLEEGLQGAAAETARVGPRRSASKGPPLSDVVATIPGSRSSDLLAPRQFGIGFSPARFAKASNDELSTSPPMDYGRDPSSNAARIDLRFAIGVAATTRHGCRAVRSRCCECTGESRRRTHVRNCASTNHCSHTRRRDDG